MNRPAFGALFALLALAASAAPEREWSPRLAHRPWHEIRTPCFQIYSCAATQDVRQLAVRLEQFREAYAMLAGAQAVASPPIVVIAFPDHATLRPFLPLYDGKPANLAAFFNRNSDENLIVLALSGSDSASLRIIFHEYSHLLLRRNQPWWPIWLSEGMAELYSTFEASGSRARIGLPIEYHVQLLGDRPLLPLRELFDATRDSPIYNERQHQGVFYAESWLLCHYLMLGGNPAHKANFRQLTPLLREGQAPEEAFTNALRTTLPAMQAELRTYLARDKFNTLDLTLKAPLETSRTFTARTLTPMEVCYRLGDELLHIGRPDTAEKWFQQAMKLAPASPLPYEGLALLAAQRDESAEAVRLFRQAAKLGPLHFLAHYTYARELYLLTAHGAVFHRIDDETASPITAQLEKSLALMPAFGPAHHLLGFLQMVQGEDLAGAEKHLDWAVRLEPENQAYSLSLAQVQMARKDPAAARRTLEPLRLRYVAPQIRAQAEEMLRGLTPTAVPPR